MSTYPTTRMYANRRHGLKPLGECRGHGLADACRFGEKPEPNARDSFDSNPDAGKACEARRILSTVVIVAGAAVGTLAFGARRTRDA